MRYFIVNAFLSFILTIQSYAVEKENADATSERSLGIKLSSLFPQQFSVDQLKGLQNLRVTDNPRGKFELDENNHKKLLATNPYLFQVWTGSWSGFAENIKIVPGSEQPLSSRKFQATYRFHSPYWEYNNADFDVTLKLDCINLVSVTDSVLGNNDFLAVEGQPISNSSFFFLANTDEQFIRETHSPRRLNVTMSNWLLILAQLDGEAVYLLSPEGREQRKEELYKDYLREKKLKLNEQNVLTTEEYIQINDELRFAILEHFDLTPQSIPNTMDIARDNALEELHHGTYYFAKSNRSNATA